MADFTKSRLKYICSSYNSNLSTDKLKEDGEYPVFGAAGIMGYSDKFTSACEYLGIIKDGAGVGRVNLYPANSSILGTMAYILPNQDVDIVWLKYCIDSLDLGASLEKTTIPHIYFSEYGNKTVCCPPLEVQKSIANFLDQKCSEIDSLSIDIQSQIDILEEYKKSVITEAVTKGLNPDVEMKDSGIEWIGMIPAHWDTKKIKYATTQRNENKLYRPATDLYVGLENIRAYSDVLIQTETEYEQSNQDVFKTGDVLFNKLRPYLSKVWIANTDGFCTGELLNFKTFDGDKKFLFYALLNKTLIDVVNASTYGAKMPRANSEFIVNLPICIPSNDEQKVIADYLDTKCAEVDAVIADKKAQLETLAEYKKSLIYEYVTGKKEIK